MIAYGIKKNMHIVKVCKVKIYDGTDNLNKYIIVKYQFYFLWIFRQRRIELGFQTIFKINLQAINLND